MSAATGGGAGAAPGKKGEKGGNGGAAPGGKGGKGGNGGPVAGRSAPAAPLTPARIGIYALLLVAGVLVAFAGALLQAAWFPGGLVLALCGVAGLFHGGARATGTTAGALVPGAAWLLTVFVLLGNVRPEGDFLFGPGAGTYVFLLGGILAAVICATAAQMRAAGVRYGRVGG
ncbi:integral membrane protein MviN [Streptomyces sp. NBRC 110611]|uniref:DUF6113 family protein n=1 Tax=Streptomyces sp. NBRC 110611 TaxID=1621259 RepID=UPI000829F2F9|nr:DUF6113 family protein [Streptomyces sp. NBRC 110611]GAU65276.1 integral membrane protein MviN [Streptomyces sp. NBRC 110611]